MVTARRLSVVDDDPLLSLRKRTDYNAAERWFSRVLRRRLEELLEGKRNRLELLRKYPGQPNRLGVLATPPGLPRDELRLPVVEGLIQQAIGFVRADEAGGPIAQILVSDGSVIEVQEFPTKYPHIVIERIDRYAGDDEESVESTWSLSRVQNQRAQVKLNRLIDVAALALDILRLVP